MQNRVQVFSKVTVIFLLMMQGAIGKSLKLIVRSDETSAHKLPMGSYIGMNSPRINNNAQGVFVIERLGENAGSGLVSFDITSDKVKIINKSEFSTVYSNPSLNNRGTIVYSKYNSVGTKGLFKQVVNSNESEEVLGEELFSFFSAPSISHKGDIFYRFNKDQLYRSLIVFSATGKKVLATENRPSEKISYLFIPRTNEYGKALVKVRIGNTGELSEQMPDELRLYSIDASYRVIAIDSDKDPESKFSRIFQFYDTSGDYSVFMVKLKSGKKAYYRSSKNELKLIAIEGSDEIKELDFFMPAVNQKGVVVFKARLSSDRHALLRYRNGDLEVLLKEGDKVPSDKGPAQIMLRSNLSAFIGNVDINDLGDVIFHAALEKYQSSEFYGTGIYYLKNE